MDQSLGYNKQYFITALYDVTVHGKVKYGRRKNDIEINASTLVLVNNH